MADVAVTEIGVAEVSTVEAAMVEVVAIDDGSAMGDVRVVVIHH